MYNLLDNFSSSKKEEQELKQQRTGKDLVKNICFTKNDLFAKKIISTHHHKKCIFICALYFYSPLLSKCGILNTTAVQQIYRHLRYKSKNGHKAVTASCATTFLTPQIYWSGIYILFSNEERHTHLRQLQGVQHCTFFWVGDMFLKVLSIK